MIKLIVFDLRKTLAYRDAGYDSTYEMVKQTGIAMSEEELTKIFEQTLQTRKREDKYGAYKSFCKKLGLLTTKANIELLLELRDYAESKSKLYPHTIAMLKQLKKLGYKIGLLSNTSVFNIKVIEEKTELLNYIDYPLFSFEVGTIKPDLTFFEKMLEISGCKAQETIMIGDSEHSDFFPAKEVGMNAILFENYEQLKSDFASFGIVLD